MSLSKIFNKYKETNALRKLPTVHSKAFNDKPTFICLYISSNVMFIQISDINSYFHAPVCSVFNCDSPPSDNIPVPPLIDYENFLQYNVTAYGFFFHFVFSNFFLFRHHSKLLDTIYVLWKCWRVLVIEGALNMVILNHPFL